MYVHMGISYYVNCEVFFKETLKMIGINTIEIRKIFTKELIEEKIVEILQKGKKYLEKRNIEYSENELEIINFYIGTDQDKEVNVNGKYYSRLDLENNSIKSLLNMSNNLLNFLREFNIEEIGKKIDIKTDKELWKKYFNSFIVEGIFDFNIFPKLSRGEEGLLSFFSTFYFLKTITPNYRKRDMIILMDEVELYFHPEWQRKFIYLFNEFVKENFKDQKVQIILTSHSPFIISDLPKENVIFLDKDENDNGKCKVVESSEKKKTFGANIHTLLSDGFFMESTLGEFARSKISEVIKILEDENFRTEQEKKYNEKQKKENKLEFKDYIYNIIEMIGESIIRTKLHKMYEVVYPEKSNDKIGIIEKLKSEIDKLEERSKNPKDYKDALEKIREQIKSYQDELENKVNKNDKN